MIAAADTMRLLEYGIAAMVTISLANLLMFVLLNMKLNLLLKRRPNSDGTKPSADSRE